MKKIYIIVLTIFSVVCISKNALAEACPVNGNSFWFSGQDALALVVGMVQLSTQACNAGGYQSLVLSSDFKFDKPIEFKLMPDTVSAGTLVIKSSNSDDKKKFYASDKFIENYPNSPLITVKSDFPMRVEFRNIIFKDSPVEAVLVETDDNMISGCEFENTNQKGSSSLNASVRVKSGKKNYIHNCIFKDQKSTPILFNNKADNNDTVFVDFLSIEEDVKPIKFKYGSFVYPELVKVSKHSDNIIKFEFDSCSFVEDNDLYRWRVYNYLSEDSKASYVYSGRTDVLDTNNCKFTSLKSGIDDNVAFMFTKRIEPAWYSTMGVSKSYSICPSDMDGFSGCSDGYECVDGVCNEVIVPVPECQADDDCAENHKCIAGECVLEGPPEGVCESDDDCGEGMICSPDQTCIQGSLSDECSKDSDCGSGEYCQLSENVCVGCMDAKTVYRMCKGYEDTFMPTQASECPDGKSPVCPPGTTEVAACGYQCACDQEGYNKIDNKKCWNTESMAPCSSGYKLDIETITCVPSDTVSCDEGFEWSEEEQKCVLKPSIVTPVSKGGGGCSLIR